MRQFLGFILASAVAALSGCATTTNSVTPVMKVSDDSPPVNLEAKVRPGAMMLQVSKGEHFSAYRLSKELNGSIMLNTCTVYPQTFYDVDQDGQFFYALSKNDHYKPFGPDQGLERGLCGVKFSKNDMKVVGLIVGFVAGEHYDMDVNGDEKVVVQAEPMINIYSPSFLRKTVKFESFSDDFLYLHYMEERGQLSGYDQRNVLQSPPPLVSEQVYDYDLLASKTIYVQGAEIEVISASPNELVYKVVMPMNID